MILENLKIEDIDKLNKICYDNIANEYADSTHETCRDFDSGTICFLKKAIKFNELTELESGFNYLDIGVGTGVSLDFLLPYLEEKKANIDVLDISENMLEICKEKFGNKISNYINTSIHNFVPTKKYDLIVSSLCDPFLTNEAIGILKKSLSTNGVLLITLPANTWAKKVRLDNIQQTTFHNKNREKKISYSFCWSKSDLIKKFEETGLYNTYSRVILIDDIKKNNSIGKLNNKLIENEKRVPMLVTMKFINK